MYFMKSIVNIYMYDRDMLNKKTSSFLQQYTFCTVYCKSEILTQRTYIGNGEKSCFILQ